MERGELLRSLKIKARAFVYAFSRNVIQSRNNENTIYVYSTQQRISRISRARQELHPRSAVPLQLQVATSPPCTCTLSILFAGRGERMARTCTRLQIPCNKVCKKVNVNVFQNGSRVPTDATPLFFPTAYSKCIRIVSHARDTLPVQFNFPRFDRLILYRLSLRNQIIF